MSIFFPTEYVGRMEDYDFEAAKKKGKRLILFDIDNTIVSHGAKADESAIRLVLKLKDMGFSLFCVSNNALPRVKSFAMDAGTGYVYKAGKPLTKGFKKAMDLAGFSTDQTLYFGDQIFTDILGANLAGLDCVLVDPIDKKTDTLWIKFKRFLEWPVKKCFF